VDRDYDAYVLDPADDKWMDSLAVQLLESVELESLEEVAGVLLSFVQYAIAYDWVEQLRLFEYPRYPLETLIEGKGDCEDTAILFASLARELGIEVVLAAVSTSHNGIADHMVVLVPHEYRDASAEVNSECHYTRWIYEDRVYVVAETAVDPESEIASIPIGCDVFGLEEDDFVLCWDVGKPDASPEVRRFEATAGLSVPCEKFRGRNTHSEGLQGAVSYYVPGIPPNFMMSLGESWYVLRCSARSVC